MQSRVCSSHFVDGEPTPENPYPTKNLGYLPTSILKQRRTIVKHSLPPSKKKRKELLTNGSALSHNLHVEQSSTGSLLFKKFNAGTKY